MGFYDEINRQMDLLRKNGYDEVSLGAAEKPGYLKKQLETGLSGVLRESLFDHDPQFFSLDITAWLDNYRHMVNYGIEYRYDPGEAILSLHRLHVREGRHSKVFELKI